MIEKYILYLGLNDKNTKTQKISTLEAYKITMNLLTQYTDGGTIFEADGFYKHDDGTVTIEKTLRIELMFIEAEAIENIVKSLKDIFNQESIAVQHETVESKLM